MKHLEKRRKEDSFANSGWHLHQQLKQEHKQQKRNKANKVAVNDCKLGQNSFFFCCFDILHRKWSFFFVANNSFLI